MAGRLAALRRRLVVAGFAAGWRLVVVTPLPVVRAAFGTAADVVWWRRPPGVRRLERNLARVAAAAGPGAVRSLSRRAMRSYFRYWLEVFRLPVIPPARLVGEMDVRDEPVLRRAVASGRGVVLALPHMGNWDHAGAWLVATGVPFTTVAERLQPEALFDRFLTFRRSLGMEVLPLTGGAAPYRVLAERLRAGGCVCLVADRDLSASGIDVTFFGETARMPGGPAALALSTGAALLPVSLWYAEGAPRGWRARIHPEVVPPAAGDRRSRIAAMTQALADTFAVAIAEHPADWHMLQPLWVADLARPPGDALTGAA